MYVYMCTFYVCMYLCVHTYVYMYIYACMYVYVCIYKGKDAIMNCVPIYVCMHVCFIHFLPFPLVLLCLFLPIYALTIPVHPSLHHVISFPDRIITLP